MAKIAICADYGGESTLTMSEHILDIDLKDLGIITNAEFKRRCAAIEALSKSANEESDRAVYERLKKRFGGPA